MGTPHIDELGIAVTKMAAQLNEKFGDITGGDALLMVNAAMTLLHREFCRVSEHKEASQELVHTYADRMLKILAPREAAEVIMLVTATWWLIGTTGLPVTSKQEA